MSNLERITHISLIAVSLVAAGLLIEGRLHSPQNRMPGDPNASLVGRPLSIPNVDWHVSRLNVVLFISTQCHFCAESVPFYRQLADASRNVEHPTSFSVISLEPSAAIKAYLARERVPASAVYQLPSEGAPMRGTPTLMVVDSGGIVRRVLTGKLGPEQERETLSLVMSGSL